MLEQTQANSDSSSQAPLAAMVLLRESILLAFVFLTCSVASLPPTATSTTTDYLALMLFKSLVKGDPMGALASWGNLSIPMCQWRGVACGSRGHRRGHVVALDLTGLNLLGTILGQHHILEAAQPSTKSLLWHPATRAR